MLGLDTLLENGLNPHLKLEELLANPVAKLQGQVPSEPLGGLHLNMHPLMSPLEPGP